jgi:hypothetical protein
MSLLDSPALSRSTFIPIGPRRHQHCLWIIVVFLGGINSFVRRKLIVDSIRWRVLAMMTFLMMAVSLGFGFLEMSRRFLFVLFFCLE